MFRGLSLQYPAGTAINIICDFKNGFPGIDHNTSSSFYQILSDGKNLKLLKRFHKTLKETFVYGSGLKSSYAATME